MEELKTKTVTYFEVDYNDLDNFLTEVYGHQFEVVADEELGNDSSKSLTVRKQPLDKYGQERVDKFVSTGRGSFLLHSLMQDCCNKGLIEPGEYLIEVSW